MKKNKEYYFHSKGKIKERESKTYNMHLWLYINKGALITTSKNKEARIFIIYFIKLFYYNIICIILQ